MIPPSNWLEIDPIKTCKTKLKGWSNKDLTNKAIELFGKSVLDKSQIVKLIKVLKEPGLVKSPDNETKVPTFSWKKSSYQGLNLDKESLLEKCFENPPTDYGKISRKPELEKLGRLPDNTINKKRYWGIQEGDTANNNTLVVSKVTPSLAGPPTIHLTKVEKSDTNT